MVGDVVEGTIRIKLKDLTVCERKNGSWKKVSKQFPRINQIVQLFKAHNNLDILIDKKNSSVVFMSFIDGEVNRFNLEQSDSSQGKPNRGSC